MGVSIGLTSCGPQIDSSIANLSRTEENRVVLASTSVALTKAPLSLTSKEPMMVLGEWTSVCLVMRGDVPSSAQPLMDAALANELHGSSVTVVVQTTDGLEKMLRPPLVGWRKHGVVLPNDELAGCASASCDARLPKGAVVKSIEVSAQPNLDIKGIYWVSTSDLPRPVGPSPSVSTSSGARSDGCGRAG